MKTMHFRILRWTVFSKATGYVPANSDDRPRLVIDIMFDADLE